MDEKLVLIVIAAVILPLVIIIWIISRRRRESALDMMRAKSASAAASAPGTLDQIHALTAQGDKIEAIRVLRESTGMGLAQAKATVERLEAGDTLDEQPPRTAPAPAHLPAELVAPVRGLLQRGDKVGAIQLVRERTGLDLKDAKDLVDRLE